MKKNSYRIPHLRDLIRDTGYWMTVDEFIKRGEESLELFRDWGENTASEENQKKLHASSRYFFSNSLYWMYPFTSLKERDILPLSVSKSDQDLLYTRQRPTELMQKLISFKYSVFQEALEAAQGHISPSALKEKAYSFLQNAVKQSDLMRLIKIELEWYSNGIAEKFYQKLPGNTIILRNSGSPLLLNCFHEKHKSGGSLGICGSLAFLLFMAEELEHRNIHSLKQEATQSNRNLRTFNFCFYLNWEILEADDLIALDSLDRKAEELHKKLCGCMVEYYQDIREILFPDEEVDIYIPCRVPRSQLREMKKELKSFMEKYQVSLNTEEVNPADNGTLTIEKDGALWCYRYKGVTHSIPAGKKGLSYIEQLVLNPDMPISCVDLYTGYHQELGVESWGESNLDDRACKDLKRRLCEIEEEIEIKRETGNPIPEKLMIDMEIISKEITNNHFSSSNPDVKKATQNVSNAITRAIEFIEGIYPSLGHHLRSSITKGVACIYETGV